MKCSNRRVILRGFAFAALCTAFPGLVNATPAKATGSPQTAAKPTIASSASNAATSAAAAPAPDDPRFAEYLLNRVDDVHRGDSSHGTMAMNVKTDRYERSMTMESWSLGEDFSLIRILEPKKERGSATLKAKGDLFTYLSKSARTVKLSGATMGGSWMGSHFTNDDLVKDSRLADDFDFQLQTGPNIGGEPTWVLILTPKEDTAIVWGRVDVMVRKKDLLPAGQLFYDEDKKPVRKLEFFDYQAVNDRTMPMRVRMTPLDKAGEYTEVRYQTIEFGVKLSPAFFSLQQLKAM